jgi:arylsulfatase A-like enzyme
MRKIESLSVCCGLILANSAGIHANEKATEQPNVIIVFLDDSGYGDWGCYGNMLHRTPVVDRMATEGMRFTNFYVSSGVSTPSRSSLMTGCYSQRISMHVNADPQPLLSTGRQVLLPASRKGLNTSEITIAKMLKEQGYATACIGKWHLGDQLPFLPTRRGFDYYYGIPYSNDMNTDFCPLPLMEQEEVIVAPVGQDSLTLRFTAKAIEFIQKNKDKPFFLYLAHSMPHYPMAASPAFKGKSNNGLYGDAIEELDWSMGEIFATLKKEGIDKNTLVIFSSDNGAAPSFGGSNLPLRGWKGSTNEGGERVPCIIRWPGKIPAGSVNNEIVTSMDIFPTIAHYCNGKVPDDRIIDGKNIAPLLEGIAGAKSQTEVFYYYQRQQLQAVRWGKWKYHLPLAEKIIEVHTAAVEPSQAELYDLEKDISESNNLVAQHPEIVTRMEILIRNVRDDMGDWGYEGKNRRPAGVIDEPFPRIMSK